MIETSSPVNTRRVPSAPWLDRVVIRVLSFSMVVRSIARLADGGVEDLTSF
jgi:hypothetical protein